MKMKVRIKVGPYTGKIFEGEYNWMDHNTQGVTIPELNNEFFWAGNRSNGYDKTGNCLNGEYENLWAPYYITDLLKEEICVGDNVVFCSDKIIRYGRVEKIIPSGYNGGISTTSKVTIREFDSKVSRTYQHLGGIVKMENVSKMLEKFKLTNP